MLSLTTILLALITLVCLILACIDFTPKYHHSQDQKRSRGKFVRRGRTIKQSRIRFVRVNARTLRRVA